jgi:copper chaperone CopZ
MTQVTLYAHDITCDHCIATIKRTTEGVEGVSFVAGDEHARSFVVDFERASALDTLGDALATEGYPLGEAVASPLVMAGAGAPAAPAFEPTYEAVVSDRGATIVHSCPCGSTTEEFEYDRSATEQAIGSCCNHHVLVGPNAGEELRTRLPDAEGYDIDVRDVTMPWGQPMQAAMAVAKG